MWGGPGRPRDRSDSPVSQAVCPTWGSGGSLRPCSPARGARTLQTPGFQALGVQRAQRGRGRSHSGPGRGKVRGLPGHLCGRVEGSGARARPGMASGPSSGPGCRPHRKMVEFHPMVPATLFWDMDRAGQGDLRQTPFEHPAALSSPSRRVSREAGSQRTPARPPGRTGEGCTAWEAPPAASPGPPATSHHLSEPRSRWRGLHNECHREPDRAWWGRQSPRWGGQQQAPALRTLSCGQTGPRDKDERGTPRTARQPPVTAVALVVPREGGPPLNLGKEAPIKAATEKDRRTVLSWSP